jgi:hypothetical protein
MAIAQRFALVDEIDLEVWVTGDVPTMVNAAHYLNSGFPNMKIGLDSMCQGGFNINLWGTLYNGGPTYTYDHPATYAAQRVVYQTSIGQVKTALGRPFDTLIAEFNGDSDGTVQGGSEFQIVSNQLDFMLNCGWIT